MSAVAHSDPKIETPDEQSIDGWEDDLDKLYDWRANNPSFMRKMRKKYQLARKGVRAFQFYRTTCKSRGFDPEPQSYPDDDLMVLPLESLHKLKLQSEDGACHALNLYNLGKEKKLELVKVTKAVMSVASHDGSTYLYITFEAKEEGNPTTEKTCQTRVKLICDEIVEICSFRLKPLK